MLCNGIAFILFFLFWLLVYLNPNQNVFRYIAWMATAVLACSIAFFLPAFYELSYEAEKLRFILSNALFPILMALTLFVAEFVLRGKISLLNKIILPTLAITSIIGHLYNISPPFGIANSTMLAYFAYLIYTHRKAVTRTHAIVLASMIIPTLGGVAYVMLHKYNIDLFHEIEHPIVLIVILSTPVLLMVYISVRFREVLREMAAEAEKVLKITEEKKSILENQNQVLENQVEERTREVMQQKEEADLQRKRSEELLLNILPGEVAEELKTTGYAQTKAYTMVTVMFTDFKDFTSVSEKVSAELLVEEIHYCFSMFDKIIQKYTIEKIKTIGDAYLCAAGLPVSNYTHALDIVNAAIEIRDFMLKRKAEKEAKGEIPFVLRVGIHTGPVVAGVVGIKKYAYDIWGDTVNLAARMEQNCEPGKINISGATYELVKDLPTGLSGKFRFEHRGKIEAKNKGQVDMYYVEMK
jgi:class 3 adenylate cyclase